MKRQESKFDIYNLQFTMTRSVPATTIVTRGFTGHEHLDDFKLINMNGRVYDPVLGRFLSADPYVQDATNSQFFNRYSYCVGNPLKYVDPSGYEAQQYYHQSGLSGLTSLMNQYDKLYGRGDYGCNGPAVSALNVIWLSTIGLGSGNGAVSLLLMASESGMLLSTDQRLDGQQGQAIFSPLPSRPGQRGVYIQVSGCLIFTMQNGYTVDVASQDVHCIWVPIGGGSDNISNIYEYGIGIGGIITGAGEYSNAVNGSWKGVNGKWYSKNWWGNQYTGMRSAALNKAGVFKTLGRGLFWVGAVYSIYNGINAYNKGDTDGVIDAGTDVIFGAIGTFGGPVGWVVSGGYFALDALGAFDFPSVITPYEPSIYPNTDNTNVSVPQIQPLP